MSLTSGWSKKVRWHGCGAAGIAIIVAGTVAHACARYSGDKVNGVRWVLLMLAAGGVVTIYFIIIPRYARPRRKNSCTSG
jgi:hypothetical protein